MSNQRSADGDPSRARNIRYSLCAVASSRAACAVKLAPLLLLILPPSAQAQWQYTTNNGTITIAEYTGSGGAVNIPSTITGLQVTTVGSNTFEYYGYYVTSVTIPDCVTNIGDGAFYGCPSLTAITAATNNPAYCSVAGVLFNRSQTTLVQCPEGEAGTFTVPSGVTTIASEAFAGCGGLTNIIIPEGVTSIGDWAFAASGVTNITIPESVTNIGDGACASCASLTAITVSANNPAYSSAGGVLFNKSQTALLQCPAAQVGSYTVQSGVTNIGPDAFCYCTSLTSVTIPDQVTGLGAEAFYACYSLTNVTIPSFITSIGESTFYEAGLTSVVIPGSVASIGDSAFQYCSSLTSVAIPNNVTNIGDYGFYGCAALAGVTIGSSVTHIGDSAFAECQNLAPVTMPDSLISIGDQAFEYCSSFTSIAIPDRVTSMGTNVFFYCQGLTNVTIGNSLTNIGDNAFYECTSLLSVTIGNSVTSIGVSAFQGCGSLKSVTIPDSVSAIAGFAFHYCYDLTNVTLGNGVRNIGADAFANCSSLTSVAFPSSIASIGDEAFNSCSLLSAAYFKGNAPGAGVNVFYEAAWNMRVYHLPGTAGWGSTFGCAPTALWTLPYPLILSTLPSFGVHSNGFGFTVSWATNLPVVIEACTNLATGVWFPISSNVLSNGTNYFSDSAWANDPARFYRIRSP